LDNQNYKWQYQNNSPSKIIMDSRGLLHKVSRSSGDFALVVDKHHRGSRTTTHPSISFTISSHLISSTPSTAPKHHHKIPATQISHHGHIEEHQELIKRRNRAARKEEQGDQPNQIKQDKDTDMSPTYP
jgi:hypothetical protein